jgi:hypothetical protein
LCAALVGCAAAPDFEASFAADEPDAFAFDHSAASADTGAPPLVEAGSVAPIVIPAIPGVGDAGIGALDASAGARSSVPDAGAVFGLDAASGTSGALLLDAAVSGAGSTGSSSGTRDASTGTTQSTAPSCNPATCSNNCGLLERCCDLTNQCACQDLFSGLCILPSLPGLPGFPP